MSLLPQVRILKSDNVVPECVANFDCGFNCYDASEPIPAIRCLVPDDPVAMCEQTCLKRSHSLHTDVLGAIVY